MSEANVRPTPILDYSHPRVREVVEQLKARNLSPRRYVQAAHRHVADVMRPVYSIDEDRPVSELLRRNEGSCSQRMACVEALVRGTRIATRVRALWLHRCFWRARLPRLRLLLPRNTLMPWPQFLLEGAWVDFDEIYGSTRDLALRAVHPFTNRGESLFDAVEHVPVDFLGKSISCGRPAFSLARLVIEDSGFFDSRDELLRKLDHRSRLGRLIFKVTYEGRPVRRLPD